MINNENEPNAPKAADVEPDTEKEEENCCKKCFCTWIVKCPCGYAILTLLCCLLISGGAWIDVFFADTFPHNIETDVSAYIRVAHAQVTLHSSLNIIGLNFVYFICFLESGTSNL